VAPSWYGDSVSHYEGYTPVIDTVGVKIGPFAMVDFYGTPYTQALHVVERYRLLDYEAAKEGLKGEFSARDRRRCRFGARLQLAGYCEAAGRRVENDPRHQWRPHPMACVAPVDASGRMALRPFRRRPGESRGSRAQNAVQCRAAAKGRKSGPRIPV
jgi:hypothetical protein